MFNEILDPELVSLKYRIQDMIVNYFKKTNKLDLLEYKFTTDLDSLESLSYEINTQKEILKQLNKYYKETCKKCQFKILQTIKNIRSVTPSAPSHVRRRVAIKKNVKYTNNKKSVSPTFRELKINENQNIDDISSIIKDDRTSFYSTSNNNIIQAQKQKQKNLGNKNKHMNKIIGNNNINIKRINKNNNKEMNRKLTPDRFNINKNKNLIRNNNIINKKNNLNLSEDKYNNKKKINQKDINKTKTKFNNNIKTKNNSNKSGISKDNIKTQNLKNINGNIKHKYNKTEYKLEDYQVIGDYIPRFPDEKDLEEDDYFYYDTDKENKNKLNIKNNNQNEINDNLNKNKKEKETINSEISFSYSFNFSFILFSLSLIKELLFFLS